MRSDRRPAPRGQGSSVRLSTRLCTIVTLLLIAAPAGAHSFVKSTSPKEGTKVSEAPSRVVMRFNERVEISFGSIRVLGPEGNRVDRGDPEFASEDRDAVRVALADDLPNGRYTVAWRMVAADGHIQRGRWRFHVAAPVPPAARATPTPTGHATATMEPEDEVLGTTVERPVRKHTGPGKAPAILLGVTRWMTLAALILLAGLVIFGAWVWRRPKGTFTERTAETEEAFAARWGTLARRAWIAAVVATVASLFFQGAVAAEVPLSRISVGLTAEVLGTRYGQVALLRLGLLAAAILLWRPAFSRRLVAAPLPAVGVGPGAAAAPAVPSRAVLVSAGLLCVGLLATVGLAGHAGTTPPVALNMAADILHLAGAATWLGGLVTLIGVAFPATKRADEADRVCILAPVVASFSDLAVISVATIVGTGVLRSWIEVETISGLTGSTYGLVLLTKVATFIPVLALGALNKRVTLPRCQMAAEQHRATPALRQLRRLVTVEVLVGAAILGLTAFLVNLPPPRAEPGQHL